MPNNLKLKRSFTLMELMMVVLIASVLATLAFSSYVRTMQRAKEQEMINNLYMIYGAARVYKIKKWTYPTQDLADVAAINQTLGLSIPPGNVTYQYFVFNTLDANKFKAISPEGWELHFHAGINYIHCGAGIPCPTCSFEGGAGCGRISNY